MLGWLILLSITDKLQNRGLSQSLAGKCLLVFLLIDFNIEHFISKKMHVHRYINSAGGGGDALFF